jgi:hypothetical protein
MIRCSNLRCIGQIVALALATLAGLPAARAQQWDTRWYDPKPADGDIAMPLPCGGMMIFRPVDVLSGNGVLDDKALTLGSPEARLGYAEFVRAAFLAAPFPIPGGGGRRYYLGKYDVTRDQYAAMRGECHPPSPAGLTAMNQVSFGDAAAAATLWSSWLLANARDKLPRRDDALAFARLPTEDEWEYAARGGARVDAQDFLAPTWPMPEGAERYIMAGSRATGGRVQQVGLRLPNPLGLYDMLGNVGQMMLDPFRLNRVGREYGQAGGITVRGGDYTFAPDDLYTAMRAEVPPYNPATNAPTKLATMGFRLALSAVAVSEGEVDKIRSSFDELDNRLQGAGSGTETASSLLASLRDSATDAVTRQKLDRIAAAMASDRRARDDAAQVALDAQLEAATVLAEYIWRLEHDAKLFDAMVDIWPRPEEKQSMQAQARTRRDWEASPVNSYMTLLQQALKLAPGPGQFEAQVDMLRKEMEERHEMVLTAFIPVMERHGVALRDHPPLSPEAVRSDLVSVPTTTR